MADSDLIPAALAIDALNTGDARAAFDVAASAHYRGIAFGTNHPELNPEALGQTARRHVKTILSSKHLGIESVRAAVPRTGLADPATIDRTLDNARKAITLARELGVGIISLNAGNIGGEGVPEGTIVSALRQLAQYADAAGMTLAISADDPQKLPGLLKQVDYERAKINLDTGRFIGAGGDVAKFVEQFGLELGQFTAADAIRAGASVRAAELGEGQLPLRELLAVLREQHFGGPMVVDVRDLPNAAVGAQHAAALLGRLLRG